MVADTADGADGVVGSVLAHGRYPDGPRSQPPLTAEDDLNPLGPSGLAMRTKLFEATVSGFESCSPS